MSQDEEPGSQSTLFTWHGSPRLDRRLHTRATVFLSLFLSLPLTPMNSPWFIPISRSPSAKQHARDARSHPRCSLLSLPSPAVALLSSPALHPHTYSPSPPVRSLVRSFFLCSPRFPVRSFLHRNVYPLFADDGIFRQRSSNSQRALLVGKGTGLDYPRYSSFSVNMYQEKNAEKIGVLFQPRTRVANFNLAEVVLSSISLLSDFFFIYP